MHPRRPAVRLDIRRFTAALAVSAALVVTACGTDQSVSPSPEPDALRVVATSTVLGDLVAQVGGTRVHVESLVPKGGEVHTFDPTPANLTAVANADLIFMNGLGLDEWLARLTSDSGATAPIFELAEDLPGVEYIEGGHHDEDEAADHDEMNPHLWLNVAYAIKYVERIGDALAEADPGRAAEHRAGADAYIARLLALDAWVREQLAAVPPANRRVVSFHEALPYFAAAYGLEIVGTVVSAPGQDPSAGELAALIDAIRETGAVAIFSEVQFSPALAETVAREADVTIETELYTDSLGDPPVDTYEGLIRWDVERIVTALGG